ncbi:MAG: endonuclease/exonuclease/phosphatase family protein [Spirochaetaceae bacterium]|nr:endonuclease/exonuclease/phosphatase family protein [Spirochaetaceae bacterium]
MRVATFNILHGRSVVHGEVIEDDLRAAAREIDADIVGLQEVDLLQARSGAVDQTAVVADALGAGSWLFVPALHGTPGAEWAAAEDEPVAGPAYGVGLVSRFPVRAWSIRRFGPAPVGMPLMVPGTRGLTHVADEPRVAVAAQIETPSGPLTVVTAHLSFVPGWNIAQLRALARWARSLPGPRLLIGDFNLPGALPRLSTRWAQPARVRTYPSWRPRVQLDHILIDGLPAGAVTGARAVLTAVSDHCALVVDL